MEPPKIPDTLIIVCAHAVYVGTDSPPLSPPSPSPILPSPPAPQTSDICTSASTNNSNSSNGTTNTSTSNDKSTSQSLPSSNEQKEWFLEKFQVGESETFIKHVEAGVREHWRCCAEGKKKADMMVEDRNGGRGDGAGGGVGTGGESGDGSVLVFSGGAVKKGLMHDGVKRDDLAVGMRPGKENIGVAEGPPNEQKPEVGRTEASGYLALTRAKQWFGYGHTNGTEDDADDNDKICVDDMMTNTVLLEDHSTDSFQNILFSLIRYHQHISQLLQPTLSESETQRTSPMAAGYPKNLVIISHEFKRRRFMELHVPALRFPKEQVRYIGIDPPWEGERRDDMIEGERKRGYQVWEMDMYGVGPLSNGKRKERGWDEDGYLRDVLGVDGFWFGDLGWKQAVVDIIKGRVGRTGGGDNGLAGCLPWEESGRGL